MRWFGMGLCRTFQLHQLHGPHHYPDRRESLLHHSLRKASQPLYLYIPPSSAHVPGVSTGLIYGNILCIHQLAAAMPTMSPTALLSSSDDYTPADAMHKPSFLSSRNPSPMPMPTAYLSRTETEKAACKLAMEASAQRRVFLHLPYHPNNPSSP